jgi:hypothetical protein
MSEQTIDTYIVDKGLYRVVKDSDQSTIISTPYTHFVDLPQRLGVSSGHLWPVPRKLKSWFNSGGDFFVVKRSLLQAFYSGSLSTPGGGSGTTNKIQGSCTPISLDPSDWPTAASNPASIIALATKAFNITIPTKPRAQALQFAVELRQLPSIPLIGALKRKGLYFRNLHREIGNEYLNVQFGWKPYISDVKKITKSTLDLKKAVRQFLRDGNAKKLVRRMHRFPTTKTASSVTDIGVDSPMPILWSSFFFPGGRLRWQTVTTTETWFSAGYTYYVPPMSTDWLSNIKRGEQIVNHLYGTRVDPSSLWELAPWTWLLDYFGNAGDIANNLARFSQDHLVAKYAYIMQKVTQDKSYTWSGLAKSGPAVTTSCTLTAVSKQRTRANPYGFAFNAALTSHQASIIGALGFSRLPSRR